MKKTLTFILLNVFLLAAAGPANADPDLGDYNWQNKLGRGVLNIVGSPVELARTINIQSNDKGAAYGWTMGLVLGLGKMFQRLGAGALETLTFPFDFPKGDKSPLLKPEYPWQEWDAPLAG